MAAFIIGAEVAFWLFIGLGLAVRYLLKMPRTSVFVLLLVPLIDVVLLVVAVAHMRQGATADLTHALAALYLGFSIVFGHAMIRWADQRVAHRFAGGPPPKKGPKYGMARAKDEWIFAVKTLVAWGLAMGIVYLMVWLVGDAEVTGSLVASVSWAAKIPGICAIIALTYTIWPKTPKTPAQEAEAAEEASGLQRRPKSELSSIERVNSGL
ncbi:hypothetical protein [Phytomonospora endophytica]|uniref:Uncharacterized protein n=1 Tax=Phytomonospora endophytica TaxID=714109 RepID=A0A841FFW3_9ACTN|nr:hypothetical protein [Phytomonospora endophytica]MBB6035156.1 hypothetical protein [Phytomonospora endophytica]GIG64095.1 hypothetical protein Pen01_03900 [Phytomonospora endophytica]